LIRGNTINTVYSRTAGARNTSTCVGIWNRRFDACTKSLLSING
jgi:hypothetical protein